MKPATLLFLFAAAAPAVAESPLAGVEWLVGGQWESKADLPGGQSIESRIVAEYGPGKWSMRMQYFVKAKEGEYQQYETFFWADPRKAGVQFITFSTQGAVIRGTGEVDDGVMTLHQDATRLYPEMRSIYRRDPDDKDRYVGENWWNQKAGWKRIMTATSVRKELSSPTKLVVPERRGKLDALRNFAGGEFRYSGKGEQEPLGRHWNRFSLHGRLLVGRSFRLKDGTEAAENLAAIWVDPATKTILSLSVAADGAVTTGTARVEGEGIVWETTETPREGEPQTMRSTITWTDGDNYEMKLRTKVGDGWTATPFVVVGRRRMPTK